MSDIAGITSSKKCTKASDKIDFSQFVPRKNRILGLSQHANTGIIDRFYREECTEEQRKNPLILLFFLKQIFKKNNLGGVPLPLRGLMVAHSIAYEDYIKTEIKHAVDHQKNCYQALEKLNVDMSIQEAAIDWMRDHAASITLIRKYGPEKAKQLAQTAFDLDYGASKKEAFETLCADFSMPPQMIKENKQITKPYVTPSHLAFQAFCLNKAHQENCTIKHFNFRKCYRLTHPIRLLKNLQTLYVHKASLENITHKISEMSKLRILNLTRNRLRFLPNTICHLSLVELEIGWNKLDKLPKKIGNMQTLQKFSANHNKLKALPKSFSKLKLETLDLRRNKFTNFPGETIKIKTLQRLRLQGDGKVVCPEKIWSLVKLRELFLKDFHVPEIPEKIQAFTKLEELSIQNAGLKKISKSIAKLSQTLNRINFKENNIQKLPKTFKQLINLSSLNLADNPNLKKFVSSASFSSLSAAEEVNIAHTALPKTTLFDLCAFLNRVAHMRITVTVDFTQARILNCCIKPNLIWSRNISQRNVAYTIDQIYAGASF